MSEALDKLHRILNPQSVQDYHLGMTLPELREIPSVREALEQENRTDGLSREAQSGLPRTLE